MGSLRFYLGILVGFLFAGCAGLTFTYKYYDPSFVSYDGTLLGPTPSDDIPGSTCAPTAASPHPCVIMLATEFFRLKQDYEQMQNQLNSCQSPSPAPTGVK